jgi:hypothetical protein
MTMHPLAHHADEDSLLSLLVLGGGGLSVAAAIARAWLATTRARLRSRCMMRSR